jgi:RHS repeat-associated protein
MRNQNKSCVLIFAFLLLTASAHSQADTNDATIGLPKNGVFDGSSFDTVQLNNGNLHLELPLWSLPGRGISVAAKFVYNAKGWSVSTTCNHQGVCTDSSQPPNPRGLVMVGPKSYSIGRGIKTQTCSNLPIQTHTGYFSKDPSGTKRHYLPDPAVLGTSTCFGTLPSVMQADDGSGWVMFVNTSDGKPLKAVGPDGTTIYASSSSPYTIANDANGNQLTHDGVSATFKDTLGRDVNIGGSYLDNDGITRSYTTTSVNVPVSAFFCGNGDICNPYSGTWSLIETLTLSNGMTYSFTYEQNKLGEPNSVTLPTGGTIAWTWSADPDTSGRLVTSRTVTANGVSATWNYSIAYEIGHVTDPDGNETRHFFQHLRAGFQDHSITDVDIADIPTTETKVEYFQGSAASGTKLKTVDTTYTVQDLSNTIDVVLPIKIRTTLNQTNQVSEVQTDYDTLSAWSGVFSRGNVLERREYGFGSGAPGTLARKNTASYYHDTYTTYATKNIVNKPYIHRVFDGAGTKFAETISSYDTTSLTSTSGVPAPNHDYTNFGTGNTVRGNLTSVQRWVNTNGTYLATTNYYNDLGNLVQTTDPNNNSTSFDYTDQWANTSCSVGVSNTYGYLTKTTNALGHRQESKFFPCTGRTERTRDHNDFLASRWGTEFTYDLALRITRVKCPGNPAVTTDDQQTDFSYSLNPYTITKTVRQFSDNTSPIVTRTIKDGLGRTKQSALEAPEGDILTDSNYDKLGRVSTVSNPYRAGEAIYVATTQYDALDRPTKLIPQDGTAGTNNTTTSYNGNCTTATDNQGKARKSCTDALGRLTSVYEDPSSLNWETLYQYDVLDNLKQVDQKGGSASSANWRTRTFTYDSLSRLLTANNPEAGNITYYYLKSDGTKCGGDVSAVCRKTDARNITITYVYDALNRLTSKTYTDSTPTLKFDFDLTSTNGLTVENSVGRLSRASVGTSCTFCTVYTYNELGQLKTQSDGTTGNFKTTTPTYDNAGGLASLAYPDGRLIKNRTDKAGRLNQVKFDSMSATNVGYNYWEVPSSYQSTPGFNASGAPRWVQLGSGAIESHVQNSRLQTYEDSVFTPIGGVNVVWFDRQYNFYDASSRNNGNVMQAIDVLNSGKTETYAYDALNRIASGSSAAATGGDAWGQNFTIDAWGNLTAQTATKGTIPNFSAAANTNNRLVGYTYDNAGNMTNDGVNTLVYNAENQITSSTTASVVTTYTYDANSNRVKKQTGSAFTEYVYFGSNVIAEKDESGNWTDYVFAGDQRVAKAEHFEDRIYTTGTNCSGCGWQWTVFAFNATDSYNGYVIRTGDRLHLRQYQTTGTRAGVSIAFTDGTYSNSINDQDGAPSTADTYTNQWHYRRLDLDSFAGKTIYRIRITTEGYTAAGLWKAYYNDISLTSSDGAVRPVWSHGRSVSFTITNTSGVTGISATAEHLAGASIPTSLLPVTTTAYYQGDHLGSSRMMTSSNAYPVWQKTYLPYGGELSFSSNPSKFLFTGKERDAETGCDYFGARYYCSKLARWMTPDWSAGPVPVPYADMTDPQTLNLYGYIRNNPLSHADVDGHCCTAGELADYLDSKVQTFRQDGLAANNNASPALAAVNTFANGVTGDLAQGFTNLLRTGESVGSLPSDASAAQIASAVAEEGGRVGGTVLLVVGVAGPKTAATAESGTQVAGEIGRSRVTLDNGSQVDLAGKAHFEKTTQQSVPTPHIKDATVHTGPTGSSVTYGPTRPATVGDVNAAARAAGAKPPVTIPPPLPLPKPKVNQ